MNGFRLMPEQASEMAPKIDLLFFTITALTVFFTAIVVVLLVFFAIKYRRGNRVDRSRPVNEHHLLEVGWSIIPLILGIGIFFWGAILFAEVRQPPDNAEEIFVIGKRWMWHFQHANGIRENNELHVPIGKPFKLTMISQDVIHDVFIPDFRLHQDVIPGHYTTEWFTATTVGKHHLFCAQYCGTQHSEMGGYVYTMTPADYEQWLRRGGPGAETMAPGEVQTPVQIGADVWEQKLCSNCHGSTDTTRAPSLIGIFGRQRRLQNGQTVTADNEYLRNAILNPESNALVGYPQTMPSYKELTEEQVLDLIAYIKTFGANSGTPAATTATGGPKSGKK